ncbi:MAG: response regulator [Polyangiales bacterium]
MPRILLIEDDEMSRDMLSRRLGRRGYDVLVAVDGEGGVALAREGRPDLVLMDLSLPVLDGWAATRRLRADPTTAGVPIVALSAHAAATDRDAALEAGCDDFESKPIDFPRLLAKVERQLARAGRA